MSCHRTRTSAWSVDSRGSVLGWIVDILGYCCAGHCKLRMGDDNSVAALIGTPALHQLVNKVHENKNMKYFYKFSLQFVPKKSDSEKKEMIKKIEVQLSTYNGKGKLTVDEYYSVLKVQVRNLPLKIKKKNIINYSSKLT